MADPKKNPLIGAFRTPAPGSTPVTSTEGEPKTAPPVQDTPPKAAEPPKDAVPKVKADATAHTTPGDVKKSQEPSDPEKPSTGEVAKSIDEKKGAEASKTPTEEKEPSDQDGDKSKGKSIDIVSQVPVDEIIAKSLFKIDEKDPSFKELVEDIRKNGMKVPINVNRTADGKYEVIDGNRRLAAAKKLGMKTINATIMNLPDRLLRKGQFHSNLAPRLILEVPGEGGDKSPQLSDSAKPTKVKKPEELPKATDLKGKAEGAATAGPTEAKQSKEQPKATDPKGKAEGVTPAGPTEGKKPEEPPETTDSKGKSEKSIRTPTPKVEIVSGTTRKAAASQEEIPPDFSLTIVPNDKLGTVAMMPIDLIDDFEGHPFEVRDDADMKELVASIKQVGLLEPATVIRNERKIGRFEMVAGHRRKHAAKLAGLTHIPVIVRDMDHDEATIYMVDSNLKREKLTPMEKARAYTMKTEALRRKMGRRSKEELAALEAEGKKPMTADQELAAQTGESVATVQRFKTLTKLTPPMQQMVDKGELPVNTAADIAQMKPEEQNALADAIEKEAKVPSGTAAKELKEASRAGTLTPEKIQAAVAPTKREETPPLKLTLNEEDLRPYFPDKRTTVPDAKKAIFEGLTLRNKMIERQAAKAKAEKDAKKKPLSLER